MAIFMCIKTDSSLYRHDPRGLRLPRFVRNDDENSSHLQMIENVIARRHDEAISTRVLLILNLSNTC